MKRLLVTFNLLCEIIPNYMHDVFSEKVKQESYINGRKLFPFLFLLDNNSKKKLPARLQRFTSHTIVFMKCKSK